MVFRNKDQAEPSANEQFTGDGMYSSQSSCSVDANAAHATADSSESAVGGANEAAAKCGAANAVDAAGAAGAAGAADAVSAAGATGEVAADADTADVVDAAAAATADVADAAIEDGAVSASEVQDAQILDEANAVLEEAAAADELAAAKAEAAEWKDKYIRLHAEWDTYRRRTAEQRVEEKARAAEKLVGNLIPVIDDFERSIDYARENGEAGLLGGVEAVHAKFVDALARDGVEVINPAGQPFDALEAQAVAMVPDDSTFEETVAEVYQKGYRIGKKVLRPAMVTVTTGGPKRPAPSEE